VKKEKCFTTLFRRSTSQELIEYMIVPLRFCLRDNSRLCRFNINQQKNRTKSKIKKKKEPFRASLHREKHKKIRTKAAANYLLTVVDSCSGHGSLWRKKDLKEFSLFFN
jgi:hypothetical protein